MEKPYTKLPFARKLSDEDASILTKLVKPQGTGRRGRANPNGIHLPSHLTLSRIATEVANNKNDAKNLFQIHPDMQLASSILISAILAPTDLTKIDLFYKLKNLKISDNIAGPMLRRIKEYFTDDYRIKTILPEILEDVLVNTGSYCMATLPETAVDLAINSGSRVSLESLREFIDPTDGWYRPMGLVASKGEVSTFGTGTGLESFGTNFDPTVFSSQAKKEDYTISVESVKLTASMEGLEKKDRTLPSKLGTVEISDNIELLKNPMLLEKLRRSRVNSVYANRGYTAVGMEARAERNKRIQVGAPQSLTDTENTFYPNRQFNHVPLQVLTAGDTEERDNIGHPLCMHVPSEAVIPVIIPGSPKRKVGFFLLLDNHGNPLSIEFREDYYSDIRSSMAVNKSAASQLTTTTRRATDGYNVWNDLEIDQLADSYWQVLENDFLQRLRAGAQAGEYKISHRQEVVQMMFARAMAAKHTTVLFVPAEWMTYIAFDYNEYGIGKSLIEDGKTLAVLRSIILFATTMSAVSNATGSKTLTVKLEEDDQDPYGSVELALNAFAETNRSTFPIGQTNPADLITSLQNAGLNVVVEGNPAFPEVGMDLQVREGTNKIIDPEVDQDLRKRHIQMFGLNIENMEGTGNADYATQLVNNNLMLLKRVVHYQEKLEPFLTDFHRGYIVNSGTLMDELRDLAKANKRFLPTEFKKNEDIDSFIHLFLESMYVELPKPEDTNFEKLAEEFQKYTEELTKGVDVYLNEAFFDTADEDAQRLVEALPSMKAALIASKQREWMRSHGFLTELDLLGTMSEEDTPAIDILKDSQDYVQGLLKVGGGYLEKALEGYKARQMRAEALKQKEEALGRGGSGTFGGDDASTATPGSDDLNLDGGAGGDDLSLPGEPGSDDLSGLDDLGDGASNADATDTATGDSNDANSDVAAMDAALGEPGVADDQVESAAPAAAEAGETAVAATSAAEPDLDDLSLDEPLEEAPPAPVEEPAAAEEVPAVAEATDDTSLEIPDAVSPEPEPAVAEPAPEPVAEEPAAQVPEEDNLALTGLPEEQPVQAEGELTLDTPLDQEPVQAAPVTEPTEPVVEEEPPAQQEPAVTPEEEQTLEPTEEESQAEKTAEEEAAVAEEEARLADIKGEEDLDPTLDPNLDDAQAQEDKDKDKDKDKGE